MTIPAIHIEQVHKRFGNLNALNGIDLTIEQGEFFGLLGPNGAGKSTLINIMAGLLKPTAGSVKVMGHDVVNDYQAARMALGVVPQELVFDPFFNVREMLRFQAGYFGRGKENDAWVDEVIESLGLCHMYYLIYLCLLKYCTTSRGDMILSRAGKCTLILL